MTDTIRQKEKDVAPSPQNILALMMLTIADTTWRLFVPSIGGTALGLLADNSFDTKPWCTIIGVTVGSLASIMLVYAQIKRIKHPKEKVTK